ncbi:hypothetical protein KUV57_13015 [Epibacterium sp. DP7N7-1]|nr:hypothetical protein [Epibacterium sp. DP7N7-1]
MFGFYDPASLSIGEKSAVIDFINAADNDVTKVEISSAETAREVHDALEVQKTRGITTRSGKIIDFRGSIAFNPKAPNEALLTPESEDEFGRTIPMKMAFDIEKNALPRHGFAIGQAVEIDGAMVVYKLAMRPFSMAFDRDPVPGQVGQLN